MPPRNGAPARALRSFVLGSGPLKRWSDRVEALSRLLLVAILTLSVPVALTVATVVHSDLVAVADHETATRQQVEAVLVDDAEAWASPAVEGGSVWTRVAWTAPDGGAREGRVPTPAGAVAGDTVPIWTGEDGKLTQEPLSRGDALGNAVLAGVLTVLLSAAAGTGGHAAVRCLLDRSRDRRWTAEWAQIEPRWAGRSACDDS